MDLNACAEPNVVYPEKQFERALCSLIQSTVGHGELRWAEPRRGLDIAAEVFLQGASKPRVVEIEVKSFRNQQKAAWVSAPRKAAVKSTSSFPAQMS